MIVLLHIDLLKVLLGSGIVDLGLGGVEFVVSVLLLISASRFPPRFHHWCTHRDLGGGRDSNVTGNIRKRFSVHKNITKVLSNASDRTHYASLKKCAKDKRLLDIKNAQDGSH